MPPVFTRAELAAATLLLTLGACRTEGPATSGFVLRIGHESDVASLDPTTYPEVATLSILSNIYEGLVTLDADMKLTPALAESWRTPDDRTWVFALRKGVRFHDGRLLVAADVCSSIDRARSGRTSGLKGYLASIERVEAPDEHTVLLTTSRPDPLVLNRLVNVLILPAGYSDFATRPIGTGPYEFVAWRKGVSLDVRAFADHWAGRPVADEAHFVPIEDPEKGIELLRSGALDVLRWIPETSADKVRSIPHVRLVSREGLGAYYLFFDCKPGAGAVRNPFSDRRVRVAISRAIDRPEIAKRLGGLVTPMNQLVHGSVVGYDAELPPLPFDTNEARRLLAQAGYPHGLKLTLTHRPQPTLAVVSGALREMLGRIDVELTVEQMDWARMLDEMKGHLAFYMAAWQFDDGDAWMFLRDCVFTRNPATGYGGYNAGYSNPAIDGMIEEEDRIFDGARRRQTSERLMRVLNEEVPLVPLYTPQNLYGVADRISWKPRIDGSLLAARMKLQ